MYQMLMAELIPRTARELRLRSRLSQELEDLIQKVTAIKHCGQHGRFGADGCQAEPHARWSGGMRRRTEESGVSGKFCWWLVWFGLLVFLRKMKGK